MKKYILAVLRGLGSFLLAVILLTILAVVCGWATFVERDFGTPVAQLAVYSASWFHGLVALLAMNIAASMVVRFPWRRRHLPFLMTHLGILVLLLGCLVTRDRGIEAQMTIAEGRASGEAICPNEWRLKVDLTSGTKGADGKSGSKTISIPFSGGPINWSAYSRTGWGAQVVGPELERRGNPNGFFDRVGRALTKFHDDAVRLAVVAAGKNRRTLLYDDEGIKIEIADYLCPGQFPEEGDGKDVEPFPGPFEKERANEFYALVKLRVTFDGRVETFWLRTTPTGIEETNYFARTLPGEKRIAKISLVNKTMAPGFSLYVKKFRADYEPGSSTPSSFSSLVECRSDSAKKDKKPDGKNVLISMNRPGVFYSPTFHSNFRVYQSSFSAYEAGDPRFDSVVAASLLPGEATARTKIYETVLSLNSDPGRGLKYLGSFLLTFGTFLLIRRKGRGNGIENSDGGEREKSAETSSVEGVALTSGQAEGQMAAGGWGRIGRRMADFGLYVVIAFPILFGLLKLAESMEAWRLNRENGAILRQTAAKTDGTKTASTGVNFSGADWSSWRLLPVWSDGRVMPLETFARIAVREICGSDQPVIAPDVRKVIAMEKGEETIGAAIPSLEELRAGEKLTEDQEKRLAEWRKKELADASAESKRVAARIRAIFPDLTSRSFSAAELIFAWIVEPEVWNAIPILDDPDGRVGKLIRGDSAGSSAENFSRKLAPGQVERSEEFSKRITLIQEGKSQTYDSLDAAKEEGRLDRSVATVEKNLSRFRAISFYPGRNVSPMASFYLEKILYPPEGGMMPSPGKRIKTAPLMELDTSAQKLKKLLAEEANQKINSPFGDENFSLAKTVTVNRDNRGPKREILALWRKITFLAGALREAPYATNANLFSAVVKELAAARETIRRHQEIVFAENLGSPRYRAELLRLDRSLAEVVSAVESAALYLSQTGSYRYNGRSDKKRLYPDASGQTVHWSGLPGASLSVSDAGSLDVLPGAFLIGSSSSEENSRSPWLALSTILFTPKELAEVFLIDKTEDGINDKEGEKDLDVADGDSTEEPARTFLDSLRTRVKETGSKKTGADQVSASFLKAAEIYMADTSLPPASSPVDFVNQGGEKNRGKSESSSTGEAEGDQGDSGRKVAAFSDALAKFVEEVRLLGEKSNDARLFALCGGEVDPQPTSLLPAYYPDAAKTKKLRAEFQYDRLNPFFWLWFFAAAAILSLVVSEGIRFLTRWSNMAERSAKRGPALAAFFFRLAVFLLVLSAAVTFWGGWLRAYITGWAPVTNMFETVVLLAFFVLILTLAWTLAPVYGDRAQAAWRSSGLAMGKNLSAVVRRNRWNLLIFRFLATIPVAWFLWRICYRDSLSSAEMGKALSDLVAGQGVLDTLAVAVTLLLLLWSIPRLLAAAVLFFLGKSRKKASGAGEKPKPFESRYQAVEARRPFLLLGAILAFGVGFLAYYNRAEFNPNIRPLVAVLRSNFWLTIHVLSIIVSYAFGGIAWFLALVSLGDSLFGRYGNGKKTAALSLPTEPPLAERLAPIILAFLRWAALFLTLGTILGARWADFSWGRFWSWDPKEVWALVTLLVYLVVLHARLRGWGKITGPAVGGVAGAMAIIMTWYGLSFVFGGGGRHSYAAGETTKALVLEGLIAANLLWALAAVLRYRWRQGRSGRLKNHASAK